MLRPRIIPCLLYHNDGLIKSKKFSNFRYIGDPLNAVRIFNEKRVDELIFLDIQASLNNSPPNFDLIAKIASECQMPLCYGGGIKNLSQANAIIECGVEKIALSSVLFENAHLVTDISRKLGSQSVIAILDLKIKKSLFKREYKLVTHNAKTEHNRNIISFIKELQECGVGEIVFNFVDRDGTRTGYDIDWVSSICEHLKVPFTILGGCGNIQHLEDAVKVFGPVGLGAGSLFVYKGKLDAVLINYINTEQKEKLARLV